ncbi:Tm-1-like ATP-binding domain-containing protein [Roseibium sp. SCP14]|uniref:Tm-1-like ATP-binding domain-containing protein n=1 Tax=Roseibium sp. SCP14 TaxID=3141375 RepID=UPI00333C6E92
MSKTVAILATADTKGNEVDYLRAKIREAGVEALVFDFGVMDDPQINVDFSAADLAIAGGANLSELRASAKREEASAVMARGMTALLLDLLGQEALSGVIGLGGTQGTEAITKVLQGLPYGLPKVMFSTMASGNTAGYVGIRDITMMFSVSDILGLNPFSRAMLANAAGAIAGMARAGATLNFKSERPVIGMTNLGVLTKGTLHAIKLLNEKGYEVVVFHAVGSGGAAMEAMMREGVITAVFDYGLGELADQMFGGIRACDDSRLTVAAELGLPQVIVPGGIDHIGVVLEEPNTVPEEYADRQHAFHNPTILVPRTSAEEGAQIMAELGRRTAKARHVSFLMPRQGGSAYSVEGGPLRDKEADEVLFAAAHRELGSIGPVIDVDAAAEDPVFVERAIEELLSNIEAARR